MKKRWLWVQFRSRLITVLLLAAQLWLIVNFVITGSRLYQRVGEILTLASILAVLYIVSKRDKGAYKTAWTILILGLPLFGGLLYLLFSLKSSSRRFARSIDAVREKSAPLRVLPGDAYPEATAALPSHLSQIRYLQDYALFPVYADTENRYLSSGEEMLETMIAEMEKAESYIFLEYFIIQEGVMWDRIVEVLRRKARQGVLVRVIYDDMGCFLKLPKDFPEKLRAMGIECHVFNPFRPILNTMQNNRDHRKITVIDGKVAFTGGVNLADEYINAVERFGHWKDAAVMLQGAAAWGFTLMFLEAWELVSGESEDYAAYYPRSEALPDIRATGYVQPYTDSPLDNENVGEHIYQQMISLSRDYLYVETPYLILDDSMLSAFSLAAKSGVDVRIVTPGHGDKWFVHATTRSYYRDLIRAGVKVYEYAPGFLHSKIFVSDDVTAVVGTTNLDFRSLYLHFECGAVLYGGEAVGEVRDDFLTMLEQCREIGEEDCHLSPLQRLVQDFLRLFAPLM